MDMTIPVLATVLVLTSTALAVRNWRLSRAERERSEARIQMLRAVIDDPSVEPSTWDRPSENALGDARPMSAFEPERRAPRSGSGLAWAAGGVVLLVILVAILVSALGPRQPRRIAEAGGPLSLRLELLGTQHVLDGNTLVVTGLVRNASSGETPALMVVASAIGPDGGVVGRGASSIDPTSLAPGKETSFRVAVSGVRDVSRYRLGFTADGRPVPQVDRRPDLTRTAMAHTPDGN